MILDFYNWNEGKIPQLVLYACLLSFFPKRNVNFLPSFISSGSIPLLKCSVMPKCPCFGGGQKAESLLLLPIRPRNGSQKVPRTVADVGKS